VDIAEDDARWDSGPMFDDGEPTGLFSPPPRPVEREDAEEIPDELLTDAVPEPVHLPRPAASRLELADPVSDGAVVAAMAASLVLGTIALLWRFFG
jgi:hypothetical protein